MNNKIIAWLGTITSILGAFILAFRYMVLGYISFTIGSFAWFIVGLRTKDHAMITLNLAFLVADFIGLWNNA